MGVLSKHLDAGEPLQIGEDKIYLKSLGTQHIPYFLKAAKAFSGAGKDGNPEDVFKNVDEDGLNAIQKLIDDTLTRSMPDEPEEDRKQFGLKYMMVLLPKIMEINMQTEEKNKARSRIEALKARANESSGKA